MKLFVCDGRRLLVYDVGDLLYDLRMPIMLNGHQLLDDDAARKLLTRIKTEFPRVESR